MHETLLHPEYYDQLGRVGDRFRDLLSARSGDVNHHADGLEDPDISIVIRSRNECERLALLLTDIALQDFSGDKQVLVVDSGSSDNTSSVCKEFGATVVDIDQAGYSHPRAMNRGFRAADHPYILSLVGHTNLVATTSLRSLTRWRNTENLGAIYGPAALPDSFSSFWEKRVSRIVRPERRFGPAGPVTDIHPGAMISNRTIYVKDVWEDLGGFDESYGAGGEDKAIARKMVGAGVIIVQEPVLTVHHSHSTGMVGTIKQIRYYRSLAKPKPFDADRLRYRQN